MNFVYGRYGLAAFWFVYLTKMKINNDTLYNLYIEGEKLDRNMIQTINNEINSMLYFKEV